jgi:hypothetical protein
MEATEGAENMITGIGCCECGSGRQRQWCPCDMSECYNCEGVAKEDKCQACFEEYVGDLETDDPALVAEFEQALRDEAKVIVWCPDGHGREYASKAAALNFDQSQDTGCCDFPRSEHTFEAKVW